MCQIFIKKVKNKSNLRKFLNILKIYVTIINKTFYGSETNSLKMSFNTFI